MGCSPSRRTCATRAPRPNSGAGSPRTAVSSDGSTIGATMITGVDVPHFYNDDVLIVLYVGIDVAVEALLADALGDPIAVGFAPAP